MSNPTSMTPQDNDLSTTVDAHVENIRYTLQDEHAISQEAIEHLKVFVNWLIAKERRAAAEAMRERCMMIADGWDVPCEPRTEGEQIAHSIKNRINTLPLDTLDDGRG
jgi:hypothetical protein